MPRRSRTDALGLYDVECKSDEITAALLRFEYLQKAVDEQAILADAIGVMLHNEFPDPGPGIKTVLVKGKNPATGDVEAKAVTYKIKQASEKRTWEATDIPVFEDTPPAPTT